MAGGATLIAPRDVCSAPTRSSGRDVVIGPNVVFGPGVRVGDNVRSRAFCHSRGATSPRARSSGRSRGCGRALRSGRARISAISSRSRPRGSSAGAKANHLSYLGDAHVGAKANIGAGTITCNYDGFNKSRTTIGARRVHRLEHGAGGAGDGRRRAPIVAAGSVITADVAPRRAGASARARQVDKPGWAREFRAAKARRRSREGASEASMCGIIGIIGKSAAAPRLIEALRRLEYRGYDSAGVRPGRRADRAPPRRGQARQPARRGWRSSRWPARPASATRAGRRTARRPRATRIRTRPTAWPSSITASSRTSSELKARAGRAAAAGSRPRPTPRWSRICVTRAARRGHDPGAGDGDGAEAPRRRLRAGGAVRRRARPADLRPARPPAGGRLWRAARCIVGSDALALAPFTRRITYLEDGDWAVVTPRGVADLRRATASRSQRAVRETALSGALIGKGNHRHFMHKEIYEQPAVDRRHAAGAIVNPATRSVALPELPFDFSDLAEAHDRRLRHVVTRRHGRRSTGSRGSRGCRSRSMSPRSSATATRRSRKGGAGAVHLAVGRDGRHAGGAALLPRAGPEDRRRSSTRPRARSRARPTWCCRPMPGRRSASPRPRRSPRSWPCWRAWRWRRRGRAARSTPKHAASWRRR